MVVDPVVGWEAPPPSYTVVADPVEAVAVETTE